MITEKLLKAFPNAIPDEATWSDFLGELYILTLFQTKTILIVGVKVQMEDHLTNLSFENWALQQNYKEYNLKGNIIKDIWQNKEVELPPFIPGNQGNIANDAVIDLDMVRDEPPFIPVNKGNVLKEILKCILVIVIFLKALYNIAVTSKLTNVNELLLILLLIALQQLPPSVINININKIINYLKRIPELSNGVWKAQ